MLNTGTDQSGDENSQQNAAALQQPRDDLQPTNALQQQSGQAPAPQQGAALSQNQLTVPGLRVGDSKTVITNSTAATTPLTPTPPPDYLSAAWLWLIVPIILAAVLFWPQKKTVPAVEPSSGADKTPETKPIVVEPVATAPPTQAVKKPKSKKTTKRKRAAKR